MHKNSLPQHSTKQEQPSRIFLCTLWRTVLIPFITSFCLEYILLKVWGCWVCWIYRRRSAFVATNQISRVVLINRKSPVIFNLLTLMRSWATNAFRTSCASLGVSLSQTRKQFTQKIIRKNSYSYKYALQFGVTGYCPNTTQRLPNKTAE